MKVLEGIKNFGRKYGPAVGAAGIALVSLKGSVGAYAPEGAGVAYPITPWIEVKDVKGERVVCRGVHKRVDFDDPSAHGDGTGDGVEFDTELSTQNGLRDLGLVLECGRRVAVY